MKFSSPNQISCW